MKEKWLKDIHDRMTVFEIEEPEGLWEAIEATGLVDASLKKTILPFRRKRLVTVAAVVAAVLASSVFLLQHKVSTSPELANLMEERDKSEIIRIGDDIESITDKADAKSLISKKSKVDDTDHTPLTHEYERQKDGEIPLDMTEINSFAESLAVKSEKPDSSGEDSIIIRSDFPPLTACKGPISSALYSDSRSHTVPEELSRASRVSLGFSVGSGSGLNPRDTKDPFPTSDVGVPGAPEVNDNPIETTHRLPVRTGVSIAYQINDRFSIESGLTYSYLSSELSYQPKSNYVSGTRKLYYIGVPLKARVMIRSWRSLEFYTSGGALMEKCVSGSLVRHFTLDGNSLQTDYRRERVRGLQWSANFSLGLMLNLAPSVGIYLEPGIGYYFDNHSSIPTIYQDRPFKFTLDMGLHFSFGK